jgi:hypothetical protein
VPLHHVRRPERPKISPPSAFPVRLSFGCGQYSRFRQDNGIIRA